MNDATSGAAVRHDTFWWQGGVITIKTRADETGGALGLVEGSFPKGFGPPLHVHRREDEGFYVLEGEIRFRQGEDEFVAGPGTFVWGSRGVPHTFRVESERARALVTLTPGGFERMFEEAGTPASEAFEPPDQGYDPEAVLAVADRFGFEVLGPPLSSSS